MLYFLNVYLAKAEPKHIAYWQMAEQLSANPQKALENYELALKFAEAEKQALWMANIKSDMAGSYYALRAYQKGVDVCDQALEILEKHKLKSDTVLFKIYANMAVNHQGLFRFNTAKSYFEKSEMLLNQNPSMEVTHPLFVAYNYSNLGKLWSSIADFKKALIYLQKAERVSQKLKDRHHLAFVLGNLATIQFYNGEKASAIQTLQRVIKTYESLPARYPVELSNFYFSYGRYLDEPHEAVRAFEKSIKYALESGNKDLTNNRVPWAYLEIINSMYEGKSPSKMREMLSNFRKQLKGAAVNSYYVHSEGLVLQSQGKVSMALQKHEDALQLLLNSSPTVEKVLALDKNRLSLVFGILKQQVHCAHLLAKEDKSNAEKYLLSALRSIDLLEAIREDYSKKLGYLESLFLFSERYAWIYKSGIETSFALYQQTKKDQYKIKAFEFAEKAKSVFANQSQNLELRSESAAEDSLRNLISASATYLNYLKSQPEPSTEQINNTELKIDQYLKQLPSGFTAQKELETAKEITGAVPAGSMYLNYVLTDSSLFVFWAGSSDFGVEKVNIKPGEFYPAIERFRKELSNNPGYYKAFSETATGKYLHRLLGTNKALFDQKGFENLIISPDPQFYDLSFDVLIHPTKNQFLIETKSISYDHNLGEIKKWNGVEADDYAWNVFLPFSISQSGLSSGQKALRSGDAEVADIRGSMFKNSESDRANWFRSLKGGAISLLISHGGVENNDPYISLKSSKGEEDRVFVSEIKYQKFNSPLVILSACETNKGKSIDGLGMFSLSRVLTLTGCKSVAASYWEVDDLSMSILGSLFYKYLLNGLSKEKAIRQAKLDYLETDHGKKYAHPYYWAHFQLSGNTEPVSSELGHLRLSGIAIVFILGLVLIFRNQIKRYLPANFPFVKR